MIDLYELLRSLETAAREIYEPPTDDELADAPLLDQWMLMIDDEDEDELPAIFGEVCGHPWPMIADGSFHVGAELVAIDPGRKWALTLSRWYRLGASPIGMITEGDDDDS